MSGEKRVLAASAWCRVSEERLFVKEKVVGSKSRAMMNFINFMARIIAEKQSMNTHCVGVFVGLTFWCVYTRFVLIK